MGEQGEEGMRREPLGQRLRKWARGLKRDIMALYLAMKHPRTPVYAKILAAIVVGYALSPLDLIPDFIPVLGYLDDVILLPLGIALVIRLIPRDVLDSCRCSVAENPLLVRPRIWVTAVFIVGCWLLAAYGIYYALGLESWISEVWARKSLIWDWFNKLYAEITAKLAP